MMDFIALIRGGLPWIGISRVLVEVLLKGALICALAGAATYLMRSSSAYRRNMIWVFAVAGLLILPLLAMMTPAWNIPLLPEMGGWGRVTYSSDVPGPGKDADVSYDKDSASISGPAAFTDDEQQSGMPAYAWMPLVWLAGAILVLLWFLAAHTSIYWVIRRAGPAGEGWNRQLIEVASSLGLRRKVRLLESGRIKTAMTAGLFRPIIVVPSGSSGWTLEKKRLVLCHELAHVKRWDTLIEILVLTVSIIHWFNPFVWLAVKQLRIERERDCDNAVLRIGEKPSDYAELLMNIAAEMGDPARPVWRLSTISQSSNLKDRLMSILNPNTDRKGGGKKSAFTTGLAVLALVLPLSVSGLWSSRVSSMTPQAQGVGQDRQQKEKNKQLKEEQLKKEELKKQQLEQKELKKEKAYKLKTSKGDVDPVKSIEENWKQIAEKENSAAAKVGMVMMNKGIDPGVEVYNKLKKSGKDDLYFKESEFNTLGYMFLFHGKKKEAQAVFHMNVESYPDSWNAYDSMGEALLAMGKLDKAEKFYRKSLELNPDNANGEKALKKIAMLREKQHQE